MNPEQIVFGPNTSAVLLGRAKPAAARPVVQELESVSVSPAPVEDKVVAGIRAAAEKAKSPEVAGRLSTVADMIETGQKPDVIAEAVAGTRATIKEAGGDFKATQALLGASRLLNETRGQQAGIIQEKQPEVPELINSDLVARAAALAVQKYGAPMPKMEGEPSLPTAAITPAGVAISRKTQLS